MERYKPAVPKKMLYPLAGLLWMIAGIILCQFALRWLLVLDNVRELSFGVIGLGLAVVFYRFGFKSIAQKNIARLHALPEQPCLFAFASWQSYLIIASMMTMGIMLRHSSIPKEYLAIPYEAMGVVLLAGSISYYRAWR